MKKSNIFPRAYKQANKKSQAKIGFEKTSDLTDSKSQFRFQKEGSEEMRQFCFLVDHPRKTILTRRITLDKSENVQSVRRK